MAKYICPKVASKQPPITGDDKGTVLSAKYTVAVDTSLAASDLLLFGKLPSGHEIIDAYIVSDQIESNGSPAVTLSVGVLNDAATDLVASTNLLTTSATVGRVAAGSVTRCDVAAGFNLPVYNSVQSTDKGTGGSVAAGTGVNAYGVRSGDRILCGKIGTAASTKVAGNVTLVVEYAVT